MGGKWLGLLKEIAPGVTRAAVIRDSAITAGISQWGAIQGVAPSVGMEVSPVNVRDAAEIGGAVARFARSSTGGLIVTGRGLAVVYRDLTSRLRPGTSCPRSTTNASSSPPAAWSPMGLIPRPVPARRRRRRPHPQGREASGPPGSVRACR